MADVKDQDFLHETLSSQSKASQNAVRSVSSKSMKFADVEIQSVRSDDTSIFSSLKPTLADQVRIGYFSMDRACQTEESEIIDLKETTNLMSNLVQEIFMLKKSLNYTKLALQADYDAKIEARSLELYKRANTRIAEIEKLHEERVKFIRHSFRTQLADAICKISTDYHKYYAMKGEMQSAQHQKEIDKMAQIQEEQKQNELAQQEMLDLMQLQMANEEEEEVVSESSKSPSILSEMERHAEEIRHLTDTISTLEDRIDEYSELLEQRNEERAKLENDCKSLKVRVADEQRKVDQLKKEVLELRLEVETEKKNGRIQLEKQKEEFNRTINQRLEEVKAKATKDAESRIRDVQSAARRREREMQDQVKLKEELIAENNKKLEKKVSDEDLLQSLARYKEIERLQREEILRLQKEFEKSNKVWEMKVAVLQQTMHALKDEMFLRTSLQRQSAKLQHAAITYASDGPAVGSAEVAPTKSPTLTRKYQLPNVVDGPQALKGLQGTDPQTGKPWKIEHGRSNTFAKITSSQNNPPSPTPRSLSQTQA